jgi:hypothetical protein
VVDGDVSAKSGEECKLGRGAGEQQLSFGDRLTALPMAALWTLDGSAA